MKHFAFIAILAAVLFSVAFAQYATKVYFPQGGDSLEVASGGAINIASGGTLSLAGKVPVPFSGTVNNGTSTTTIAVSGTDANDLILATPNTAGGAAVRSAVPGTNQVVVAMEGNVSTTTTIAGIAWQD